MSFIIFCIMAGSIPVPMGVPPEGIVPDPCVLPWPPGWVDCACTGADKATASRPTETYVVNNFIGNLLSVGLGSKKGIS
jgi:hypothetical protein